MNSIAVCNSEYFAQYYRELFLSNSVWGFGRKSFFYSCYFFSEIISALRPLMRAKEKDEKNTRIARSTPQCKCSTQC
jgi:hypothetical protein